MNTLTKKILGLMTFLIFTSSLAIAGDKGGNGQLIVIPNGGKDPVPYEVAKSWDSGVYRNFYKLPQVNNNFEARERFNKAYGVYGMEWLEIIKEYSPKLHQDLVTAAKKTTFRLLNNFILWEHEPYPEGEVDYKKYEKAAFFNGEIILSTIVMDKMGGLEKTISKEENQGFVIIHELINAAYTNMSIKDKLMLGELIANIKLLKLSKTDFLAELMHKDFFFLLEGHSSKTILEAANELGEEALATKGINVSLQDIELQWAELLAAAETTESLKDYYKNLSNATFSDLLRLLQFAEKLSLFKEKKLHDLISIEYLNIFSTYNTHQWVNHYWGGPTLSDTGRIIVSFMRAKRSKNLIEDRDYYYRRISSNYYSNFDELANLHIRMNHLEYNFKNQNLDGFKSYYPWGIGNYTEAFESEIKEINLSALESALRNEFKEVMNSLSIKGFYVDGLRKSEYFSGVDSVRLTLAKGQKIKFIKNHLKENCNPNSSRLTFDEIYLVKRLPSEQTILEIVSSPKPERVKQKITLKDSTWEHECSIAEML